MSKITSSCKFFKFDLFVKFKINKENILFCAFLSAWADFWFKYSVQPYAIFESSFLATL